MQNKITSKKLWASLLVLASVSSFAQSKYHREMPYPESDLIESFEWTSEPYKYPGTGSDMHWWTWGKDSAVYVVDDDGVNFGGYNNYAHVLKISGIPPKHKVETVTDFTDIDFRKMLPPDAVVRRYVDGTIAIDSILYVSIYDYDWDLERNKLWRDSLKKRLPLFIAAWHNVNDSNLQKNMWFTDGLSKNYGVAGIIKSTDGGKSWSNIPNENTPRFLGPRFAGITFVNFGPGYTDVPSQHGSFVYAMSNDDNWASGSNIFMARVHKDSILARGAWQFLSTLSDDFVPGWSNSENDALPVFTDNGHVGHPTISYNKALQRYILGVFSDPVPHRENSTDQEKSQWDKASEMQLYEGVNPWGPWKLIYSEVPWGGNSHTCYLPQIPNGWWSADGLQGTLMFAGDYTKPPFEYYALMTQSFRLKLLKGK